MPLPNKYFYILSRAFKRGTAWCFISRDNKNTSSQTFGYPSLLNKIGLFCNFWIDTVVILMPLEIKLHAAPHLKGLINCENISGWQERGSTYTFKKFIWKYPFYYILQSKSCISFMSLVYFCTIWNFSTLIFQHSRLPVLPLASK